MTDYKFHGPESIVKDALDGQKNVLGPRTLDGVSYANVRSEEAITIPEGCEQTGPELSSAILGDWFDLQSALREYDTEQAARKQYSTATGTKE